MVDFINKRVLSQLIDESITYGVFTPPAEYAHASTAELAQLMFEEKIPINLDVLRFELSLAMRRAKK